jgi:hypothetical protein
MDFGDGSNEVIFVRSRKRKGPSSAGQNSPTSPGILESNEVIFVRSRKRQRPSSAEQNSPASSQNFEAKQVRLSLEMEAVIMRLFSSAKKGYL